MAFLFGLDPSTVLQNNLVRSLTSFLHLYDQHQVDLHRALERFSRAAAGENNRSEDAVAQVLFSLFGGAVGAVCGGITGGLWGAFGAVGAATIARFNRDVNAAGATVGFFGSILGGVLGGAFSGSIGSAVHIAAKVAGHRVPFVFGGVLWIGIGFATGSAIGSTFGGSVGAAGGAVGGAFGALHATMAAGYVVGSMIDWPSTGKDSTDQEVEKVNRMRKTGKDFRKRLEPLVTELKTIQQISNKMASSDAMKSVAGQTATTLAAVDAVEESLSDGQLLSCSDEAVRRCEKIRDELQKTRAEVQKLLVSLQQLQ
ncbi:keratin, type I cytoskeletal 14-like [Stegastes partitus]|uniref:Keratin, type I cytoskeletal 14-like n=1 Tax=Stegastes partitus TaxID=144197 RepID=A0A9Y4NCV6_9TELE|nr:PREDICTED: keratin, type I cytoskeletal 14-like [Stegastes partitus]